MASNAANGADTDRVLKSQLEFPNSWFCNTNPWGSPGTDHVYHDDLVIGGNSTGTASGDVDICIEGPYQSYLEHEMQYSWL